MKIINAIHAQLIGGVDQVFRNYTQILVKNGHDVGLLVSDNGNDDYATDDVKKVFKLKNSSQISDLFNLLKIVFSFKPDIIICHSKRLMRWANILRVFNKLGISNVKSVAVNHGITFEKSLLCDYVININQQISDLVVEAGFNAEKSFILPNVIDVDQPYQEKTLRTPPTIAMYARVEKRKGFDILIKACEILATNGYDFKLKMGGFEVKDVYGWHSVKDIAKSHNIFDKCEFYGVVKDKKSFFEDVDIFCVPSREEPFGLVILESFLQSTLVISSNTDGGNFLINDKESGFLFENENALDLSEKLIEVFDNSSSYNDITKKAFLRLEKEFSFDLLEREMSDILQKIS